MFIVSALIKYWNSWSVWYCNWSLYMLLYNALFMLTKGS